MEASLVICVLAALLATGACLQCEVCAGLGKTCTGDLQTCRAGQDSCGVILIEVSQAGEKIQRMIKSCVPSSQCKAGFISMNFGKGMTIRMSITCCVGDACRTTTVTMPPPDTKPNGWRCHGCYSLFSEQCREEIIQCTGAETRCLDLAQTPTTGGNPMQMVMKGCVTESVCAQLQGSSGTFAGISANLDTAKCTAAFGEMGVPPASTISSATRAALATTTSGAAPETTTSGTAPATTTSDAAPETTTSGTAPETITSGAAGAAPGPAGLLLPALAGLLLLKLLS